MVPLTVKHLRLRAAFRRAAALTIFVIASGFACVPAGTTAPASPLQEATGGSREYLIKAAFVYELIKATRWPRQSSGRILLCVRGSDPFGSAWNSIRGRHVGAGRLQIRHLQATSSISGCDALFIGISDRDWWEQSRSWLASQPVLTLSEMTGFSRLGGMVTMMNVDNRLRFDVNLPAVRRAGLSIDTEALELANMIHTGSAQAGPP